MNKIFYQDFLFEGLPTDQNDNPLVNPVIKNNVAKITLIDPTKSFSKRKVYLSLTSLIEMVDKSNWINLFNCIDYCEEVVLVDDLKLENSELKPYKEFYINTYYYWLKQHCDNCYLYRL